MSVVDKNAIIEQILAKKKSKEVKGNISGIIGQLSEGIVSPSQNRLLFLNEMEGPDSAYNIPSLLKLTGEIDASILQVAIDKVVRRQAILRTSFFKREGRYFQKITDNVRVVMNLSDAGSEADAMAIAQEKLSYVFDSVVAPLVKFDLIRVTPNLSFLLINIHHLISDSWSLHVLMNEVAFYYNGKVNQQMTELPQLNMQFCQYCEKLEGQSHKAEIQQQLAYWRDCLSNLDDLYVFPPDKGRPALQRSQGNSHRFVIPERLAAEITDFCKTHGYTVYNFLLSVFNILMSNYISSRDVCLASPIANRNTVDEELLIGFFVNTVVMRNDVNPSATFHELIRQVTATANQAFKRSQVPFDHVVEQLNPKRSLSYSPVVQTEFVFLNKFGANVKLDGLDVREVDLPVSHVKYDFSLAVFQTDFGFTGLIEYRSDLYFHETVVRLSDEYVQLLSRVLSNPDIAVDKQNILLDTTINQIQKVWSMPSIQFENDLTYIDIFNQQVAQFPAKIIIADQGQQLSYHEVISRVHILATVFRENGIGRGDNVGFYIDRGVDYLVCMLTCFHLSCIMVPFNPCASDARNREMLLDAQPRCILLNKKEHLKPEVSEYDCSKIFLDDICWDKGCDKPLLSPDLDDVAYMIYTSGSTGKPKAAMVKHRGMINHLRAKVNDFNLLEDDVIAQIAVQTFDVSIWQFLIGQLVGAKTVVFANDEAWQPKKLLNKLTKDRITVVETVPSHLRVIIDEVQANPTDYNLNFLRYMISNGEPISTALAKRWFAVAPQSVFVNAYGPTECSDDVTHLCVGKDQLPDLAYLPLGRPIANTRVYVLDESLKFVPIGAVGEIYVAGEGVGLGYFRNSEKTKTSFISNHGLTFETGTIYKTGDLARYLPDGTLELLGRNDEQVKIRGIRIELGEVASAIEKIDLVDQCVVDVICDDGANKSLVAFVSSRVKPAPSGDFFIKHCKKILPDYMAPRAVIVIDEMPLLENGKINKKKLPMPSSLEAISLDNYVAAQTVTQHKLVEIWSELMRVNTVGIHDDFFYLGGHSLLAIELVRMIEREFKVSLPLRWLFENPTVSCVAEYIDQHRVNDCGK